MRLLSDFFLDTNISYVYSPYVNQSGKNKSLSLLPASDAINAYATLRRTHDAVHRHVSSKLEEWKLSVPKYGVIIHLHNRGPTPISEIGNLIFRCNSNLTTLIDRMERDGLVQKMDTPSDRRIKKIQLTSKGRRLASRVVSEYTAFLKEMVNDSLSVEEQRALIGLLNRLKDGCERPGRH